MSTPEIRKLINDIEKRFFRTEHDSGAGENTMMIWNALRREACLPDLQLPTWCEPCHKYHTGHCDKIRMGDISDERRTELLALRIKNGGDY